MLLERKTKQTHFCGGAAALCDTGAVVLVVLIAKTRLPASKTNPGGYDVVIGDNRDPVST